MPTSNLLIPKNKKIIVLCGKGNNGADGMALASLIKEDVIVYYLEDPSLGNKASSYYLQIVSNLNIPIKFTLDELYKDLENKKLNKGGEEDNAKKQTKTKTRTRRIKKAE